MTDAGEKTCARPGYVLGLTGSIGSGKTTAAGFFRDAGVPVWNADEAVSAIYAENRDAVRGVAQILPDAVSDGVIDRDRLRQGIIEEPSRLAAVETLIHPLVSADRAAFVGNAGKQGAPLVVCEIPLLFETGAEADCDGILVMTTSPAERRRRVLSRPGMTDAVLDRLLARQIADDLRLERADFVIESRSREAVREEVRALIALLTNDDRTVKISGAGRAIAGQGG
ncbi:MAG: dephospho-CoA kinase [Paracoccaceae bacterium]|nr:dephospho-CoA kinase [Paracoccaceae bacterium]